MWFGLTVLFSTGLLVESAMYGDLQYFLAGALAAIGFSLGAYLLFLRPKVVLFDEGLTIVNAIAEHTLGWSDIVAVETQYSLSVHTAERKIYAMAAPAPSRYHARELHASEVKGLSLDPGGDLRAGDSPRTHSGVAAHLVRTRWLANRGVDPTAFTTATTQQRPALAIAVAALLLISLLLQLIHL